MKLMEDVGELAQFLGIFFWDFFLRNTLTLVILPPDLVQNEYFVTGKGANCNILCPYHIIYCQSK